MIKDHVPDLDRCKRLKELGMPQNTEFAWMRYPGHPRWCVSINAFDPLEKEAAPIATELLKWLPDKLGTANFFLGKNAVGYTQTGLIICDPIEITIRGATLNALADLLIWCVEQGHVKWEA